MSNREHHPWWRQPLSWWTRLSAWKRRERRKAAARGEARVGRIQSWPRPLRDALAVATVALAMGLVVVIAFMAEAETRRNAELVETQPREQATFVEVGPAIRHGDVYYVQFRGEEVEADYGWLIRNPTPGAAVEVVQDPDDAERVIVVGTPEDWADGPQTVVLTSGFALVIGLVATAVAGIKFVPERAEPLLLKAFALVARFVQWVGRTRRRFS